MISGGIVLHVGGGRANLSTGVIALLAGPVRRGSKPILLAEENCITTAQFIYCSAQLNCT